MVFNSYIFILAFLPIVVLGYFGLCRWKPERNGFWGTLFLILCSLLFVGYGDTRVLVFLLISALVNYCIAKVIQITDHKKWTLVVGVLANVLCLGYFKYSGFVLQNLGKLTGNDWVLEKVFIPLGISFVTFQQIAFLVQVKKKTILEVDLTDYLFYISYFPKYIQGPITPYEKLISQLKNSENKRLNVENMAYGLYLFIIGLAKKVLLADLLAKAVNFGWDNVWGLSSLEALLTMLLFTLQIYFDFSGYSHMAIGISKMLNITLPDNFDRPYLANSVTDFWKKWHISLTDFLREYIYIPLGGNRKGKVRTYLNILIVYVVSGLWHGAAWTFVVWGLLHGLASCLDRLMYPVWKKLTKWIQIPITFLFVNIAWVFFRAKDLSSAMTLFQRILGNNGWQISDSFAQVFCTSEIEFLQNRFSFLEGFLTQYPTTILYLLLLLAAIVIVVTKDKIEEKFKPTLWKCVLSMVCLWWSILSLSTVVEFIYANF